MGRHVKETMDNIFSILKEYVADEYSHEIAEIKRHIQPEGEIQPVSDFVKLAKIKLISTLPEFLCLIEYSDQRYLLLPDRYSDSISEIGLDIESNIAITQGAGMLAIASRHIPIKAGITPLRIVNECLGITPENSSDSDISFPFKDISSFFASYSVIKLDDSRFQFVYSEDISRFLAYIMIDESAILDHESQNELKSLLLLLSSRSIAGSILNGVQNPLIEYTYLQMYQCIEYLFRLNNCFMISETHSVPLLKSMDIVLAHEFRNSEVDNLHQVLRNNASESSVIAVVDLLPITPMETTNLYQKAAEYIYRIRCNIAHLRYKQDDISDIKWRRCITALISIILSIFKKRDQDIIEICSNQGVWKTLSIDK